MNLVFALLGTFLLFALLAWNERTLRQCRGGGEGCGSGRGCGSCSTSWWSPEGKDESR